MKGRLRFRSILITTFGLASMTLLLHSLWLPSKAWLSEQLIYHSWRQSQLHQTQVVPWHWADTMAIAELNIERLDKSLVLLLGVDGTSLAFSAGVMHGFSALDGQSPFVVAGHNDTHFAFLQDIHMKDVISLTDRHGHNHLYQVESLAVIDSSTHELSLDKSSKDLVLITCYPFNALQAGGKLRYVITAKRLTV